jgi:hypothetical protein
MPNSMIGALDVIGTDAADPTGQRHFGDVQIGLDCDEAASP